MVPHALIDQHDLDHARETHRHEGCLQQRGPGVGMEHGAADGTSARDARDRDAGAQNGGADERRRHHAALRGLGCLVMEQPGHSSADRLQPKGDGDGLRAKLHELEQPVLCG